MGKFRYLGYGEHLVYFCRNFILFLWNTNEIVTPALLLKFIIHCVFMHFVILVYWTVKSRVHYLVKAIVSCVYLLCNIVIKSLIRFMYSRKCNMLCI